MTEKAMLDGFVEKSSDLPDEIECADAALPKKELSLGDEEDESDFEISPALRQSFVQEAEECLDLAEQSLLETAKAQEGDVTAGLTEAFRALHTLKGNCGFLGFVDMERLAHHMETVLAAMRRGTIDTDTEKTGRLLKLLDVLREGVANIAGGSMGEVENLSLHLAFLDGAMILSSHEEDDEALSRTSTPDSPASAAVPPSPSQTRQDIRVDIHKLDALINLVGELVIAESMVTRHPHVAHAEIASLDKAVHLLRRVSRDLQDVIMSVRMIPLAGTFRRMTRLVRDLGWKSGKQINLRLLGEETEVDKTLIEQIADPLMHIVRNAADHGIELPRERHEAGKPEEATITIEGRHEGGEVWILISDDGRGLNRDRILAKALENGLVGEEALEWPNRYVFRLIFEPGFSTAEKVTDVSGRGVGMDVVRRNIEKLKGRVDIRSAPGHGTTIILRIPLTLAIIEGMLIRVGNARYTIPLLTIRESFRPDRSWITVTPDGQEVVRIRNDFYPVLRLHERFRKTPDTTKIEEGILVLVEYDRRTIALFVDEILGQQETVIKGLSRFLGASAGISGCTILGDGEVSLILDIAGLLEEHREIEEQAGTGERK